MALMAGTNWTGAGRQKIFEGGRIRKEQKAGINAEIAESTENTEKEVASGEIKTKRDSSAAKYAASE